MEERIPGFFPDARRGFEEFQELCGGAFLLVTERKIDGVIVFGGRDFFCFWEDYTRAGKFWIFFLNWCAFFSEMGS